jgi:hypothetical protein
MNEIIKLVRVFLVDVIWTLQCQTSKSPNEFTRRFLSFRSGIIWPKCSGTALTKTAQQSQNTYNEISIQRSRHAHVYLEVQFDVDL